MDKNPYLRVKLKSLAEEARIIRVEERRAIKHQNYSLQASLRWHRIDTVRKAARETLLAYQYLRGFAYKQVEKEGSIEPNWKSVLSMIQRYGPYETKKLDVLNLVDWYCGKKSVLAA